MNKPSSTVVSIRLSLEDHAQLISSANRGKMPVSDFIRYKLFEEEKDSYIKGLKKALENEGKFGEQDYQYMDHLQDQIQELKSCIKQISHKGAKLVNLAEEGLNKNKLMVREFNQKHPC